MRLLANFIEQLLTQDDYLIEHIVVLRKSQYVEVNKKQCMKNYTSFVLLVFRSLVQRS